MGTTQNLHVLDVDALLIYRKYETEYVSS